MAKNITILEYRRRVFNKALMETFCRIHSSAIGADSPEDAAKIGRAHV